MKVSALINGASHDFLSNQFLGGLGEVTGNLGTDGSGGFVADSSLTVDLNDFPGDQFFTFEIEDIVVTDKASINRVDTTIDGITIVVQDVGTSLADAGTVKLTIDGEVVAHDAAKEGDLTTVTFAPEARYLPTSEHSYAFEIMDGLGADDSAGRPRSFSRSGF